MCYKFRNQFGYKTYIWVTDKQIKHCFENLPSWMIHWTMFRAVLFHWYLTANHSEKSHNYINHKKIALKSHLFLHQQPTLDWMCTLAVFRNQFEQSADILCKMKCVILINMLVWTMENENELNKLCHGSVGGRGEGGGIIRVMLLTALQSSILNPQSSILSFSVLLHHSSAPHAPQHHSFSVLVGWN